jgi:hypothetical protein
MRLPYASYRNDSFRGWIMAAGVTLSFVAAPELADRVNEAARIDGVSRSQAAARAAASGVLLSAAARRSLLFTLGQGGPEARQELSIALSRAVTQVANAVIKRKLLEQAIASGVEPSPEQDILDEAVAAVGRRTERLEHSGREGPGMGD